MPRTAIVLGATGLTGGRLLEYLLEDNSFEKIKLFSRRPVNRQHPKIEEHLVNLFQLETNAGAFRGDIVFCCIGTTKAKTPDKETYRKIDFGIPVQAAGLAEQNGIESFIVISSLGADPESRIFYTRTKGEMEREVLQKNIPQVYVLQPSFIAGLRNETRPGERIAGAFMKRLKFFIPKRYRSITPDQIASAMIWLAKHPYMSGRIPSEKIKEIAGKV